jgi:hypothetical protein
VGYRGVQLWTLFPGHDAAFILENYPGMTEMHLPQLGEISWPLELIRKMHMNRVLLLYHVSRFADLGDIFM